MRLKVSFIGFSGSRARSVIESIEQASSLSLEATVTKDARSCEEGLAGGFDAVFLTAEVGYRCLSLVVGKIRRENKRIPIVLTYGAEPNGKAFELASKYDCWLFSEMDRLKRGLTPQEVGEALRARQEDDKIKSRLMEVSLRSGPCSTGD